MTRKIISCTACNARFDVAKYPPGSRVRCGRCSQVLTVPTDTGEVAPAPIPAVVSTRPGPSAPVPVSSASRSSIPAVGAGQAARSASDVAPPPARPDAAPQPASPQVTTSLGTPASGDRDPLLGKVINGQYRIVRKLGEGGYGAVYEARDVHLERRVAIKVMLQSRAQSREYVAKFLREARTAAQLSHPNIVAVHGVGFDREHGVHFLAMEYVEGRTFHDILQERGPLPVDEAVESMIQSCRGLAAAHERNIIHRDIKPGNLMITPGGTVKITDFGLAKIYDADAAQSTVIGTPYFMPPEQFEGKARDGRTDIYALGVTFYYMLTMQRPHTGSGPAQILLSVMTREPASINEHRKDLPEGLWPIVRKMIDRDVEKRYSSCTDIANDLQKLMGGPEEEVEQIYCPKCGVPNPVGAAACVGCKESLLETCPVCGSEDVAGTKFCGDCGANIPLERAVTALLEEARHFLTAGRLARAREKLEQARDRSPENVQIAQLVKELDVRREQRDTHRDAIRDLASQGRVAEARERLRQALGEFPESVEMGQLQEELDAAAAPDDATCDVAADPAREARRLEEEGRFREALVAWRGVLLLSRDDSEARACEQRVATRVAQAETLLEAGAAALSGGDPEGALEKLLEANAVLPGDPLIEGRLRETEHAAAELRSELDLLEKELAAGSSPTTVARLRALAQRYSRSRTLAEALARAEAAGSEARRGAVRERLTRAVATARRHEQEKRLRDALTAWREAATLDSESADASEGLARVQRQLAEAEALLAQSRSLLQQGDPEGAERTAGEALEVLRGDPAAQAQHARSRTALETLRHEAERIRTALRNEPDDEVLTWAQELAQRYGASSLATQVLREAEEASSAAEQQAAGDPVAEEFDRASKLEADGNWVRAAKAYEAVLAQSRGHAEARQALDRLNFRLGEADRLAREALELLQQGDPEAARAAAEKSLQLLPDRPEPAGTLAAARTALSEIERAAQSIMSDLPAERAEAQLERIRRLRAKYSRSDRCAELERQADSAVVAAREKAVRSRVRAYLEAARAALEDGVLDTAVEACRNALAIAPAEAQAQQFLAEAEGRAERARVQAAQGRAALGAHRLQEAKERFEAALAEDPHFADAAKGHAEAVEAIDRAAMEVEEAVTRAETLARSGRMGDALAAWTRVLELQPSHAQATTESSRLRARVEEGSALLTRGREVLDGGDPASAVGPLQRAREILGPGESDALLATAQNAARDLAREIAEIEGLLAHQEGDLDAVAARATALLGRFAASARARDLEGHARTAAVERRRALSIARVRKLVREHRYAAARDLAEELRAEGVQSADLAAAAAQAVHALEKLDALRRRAGECRRSGDLAGARDAFRELLTSLPDDVDAKAELHEIDETIREVTARLDTAETARRRGALTQALDLYREALALNSTSQEIAKQVRTIEGEIAERAQLVRSCDDALRTGDGRRCAETARQLLERYPEDDDARDLHTTGECIERMLAALLARAERQVQSGDRDGARVTLDCLLRVAPGHAKARALLSA